MAERIIRTKGTAHGYLASPLSEHISEMPDGSLLVVDCPIARTGWQEYAVRDLPQEAARDLGLDTSNPSALVNLYRPPEEVFSPTFLASLNGRPITDGHPPQFVNPENFAQYAKGHIQNPRRGPEPLADGEWPIIADLVISAEPLLGKVRHKMAREVSLGYDFAIDRDGDKIIQCDMVANHNAVVPKGRAGDLVAIGDQDPRAAPPEPAPGSGDGHAAATDNAPPTAAKKEKRKMRNPLHNLWGRALRAMAQDADTDPEELAQAALDISEHLEDRHVDDRRARDRHGRDRRGRDEEFEIEETGQVRDRHMDDRHMDDRHMDDRRGRDRRGRDLDPEIEVTHTEDRRRMHDALDRMLDARGKDVDIGALKDLLVDYFNEEEEEPEHSAVDEEEVEELIQPEVLEDVVNEPDDEDSEEEADDEVGDLPDDEAGDKRADDCPACGAMMDSDDEACPKCGAKIEDRHVDDRKGRDRKGKDRARAADGAAATLRMLRPIIARSNDRAVKAAYNSALGVLTRRSRARDASAGYGGFSAASRRRGKDLPHAHAADKAAEQNAKLQDYYDQRRKAGK